MRRSVSGGIPVLSQCLPNPMRRSVSGGIPVLSQCLPNPMRRSVSCGIPVLSQCLPNPNEEDLAAHYLGRGPGHLGPAVGPRPGRAHSFPSIGQGVVGPGPDHRQGQGHGQGHGHGQGQGHGHRQDHRHQHHHGHRHGHGQGHGHGHGHKELRRPGPHPQNRHQHLYSPRYATAFPAPMHEHLAGPRVVVRIPARHMFVYPPSHVSVKLAPLKARWSQAQVRAHTQVQLDALQATPVEPPTPSTFTVEAVEAAEYFVDVPDEVYPGEEFRTVLEGREVVVKCPDITRIGQRIVVMVKPTVSIVI